MEAKVLSVLQRGYSVPIRDPLWGHVYLTPGLAALTESVPFMRLGRIFQLGPAALTYPGATHSRGSHSIGVYYLARRLLTGLCEKGFPGVFPLSPCGALSFLAAALLHDLGHFPYAHSLKELTGGPGDRGSGDRCPGDRCLLEEHETLSGRLILEEPLRSLIGKAGADPELTAAIIDKNRAGRGELHFFRRLLSGVLDPDKLDYLNRDARYCGVPYGAQDVDFIYSRLLPHPERGVDIDSRGIPSVESILFSKYLMYRTVYWHRQVRSATAMIKKALLAGLGAEIISGGDLYNLDDEGLFSLLSSVDFEPFSLARQVRDGKCYVESVSFPFEEAKHGALRHIEKRKEQEEALAAEIGRLTGITVDSRHLIIDVPEPVSFETDLYVRDESRYFGESSSAFKKDMVDAFVKSLRVVRIFTEFPLAVPEAVIKDCQKWLEV